MTHACRQPSRYVIRELFWTPETYAGIRAGLCLQSVPLVAQTCKDLVRIGLQLFGYPSCVRLKLELSILLCLVCLAYVFLIELCFSKEKSVWLVASCNKLAEKRQDVMPENFVTIVGALVYVEDIGMAGIKAGDRRNRKELGQDGNRRDTHSI